MNVDKPGRLSEDQRPYFTLLDHYAAFAMHAELMTTSELTPIAAQALADGAEEHGQSVEQRIAANAYRMAEAMLAERSK